MGGVKRERRLKLKGGVACLDFVNTVSWRLTDRPSEYLRSYEDVLAWGRQAGLLTPQEAEGLARRATLDPEGARETLSRALALEKRSTERSPRPSAVSPRTGATCRHSTASSRSRSLGCA